MDLYSKVIKEVEASPEGPEIGAFFDFDGTIIYGYSATTYLREQIKRGDIKPKQLVELTKTMVDFGLGNMGFSAMMTVASQFLEGIDEAEYQEFAKKLYKKHIAKLIYPESRALIEAHLKKGHTVAIVSAATPYQVTPAAKELGVEHVKCSNLEVLNGKFTGAVLKPTCYGMGKVDAAESLGEQFNIDMQQSYFYSDSDEDIQLLEYVGKPRPLNPNKRLRSIAKGRGWPVQDFNSRGKAGLNDYLKTFAAQVSMLTSFVAGIPIYALTGSMNKTRNFSISLFADTACALTGIELDVEGEENAWANRPCVFMFNHQSQADTVILPALLRRDLAGVGKKEIGDVPILGTLMKIGGTVLIDRDNSASARDAMKPLVDVLQKEGRSVCIAPEGTRSSSTNLGRFKKGGFHLAMQAGVPIVPIVIHNAIDVAPRGQYVLRPATVKVTVLPAVDTSNWKGSSMNEHVDDVRDMFLEALDQMQFQLTADEVSSSGPSKGASRSSRKPLATKKPLAGRKPLATKTPLVKNEKRATESGKPSSSKPARRKKTPSTKRMTSKASSSNELAIKKVSANKVSATGVDDSLGLKGNSSVKTTKLKRSKPTKRKPKVVEAKRIPRRRAKKKPPPKVSAKTIQASADSE